MGVSSRRQREKQERRDSIVDAAEAVFRRKGFAQATMDDIAAAAELSKGTLYLYFRSKDDLFIEMVSRFMDGIADEYDRISDTERDGIAALSAMMTLYARRIADRPELFRTMVGSLASGDVVDSDSPAFARHRALVARLVGAFVRAIERGGRGGTIRADIDPAQTAPRLWGGMLGILLVRLNVDHISRRFPSAIDPDGFVPGYLDLVCNGLRPREPAAATDRGAEPTTPHRTVDRVHGESVQERE